MAPGGGGGGGLAGPRLLSILSSLASDGPFSIIDRILSWKKTKKDSRESVGVHVSSKGISAGTSRYRFY